MGKGTYHKRPTDSFADGLTLAVDTNSDKVGPLASDGSYDFVHVWADSNMWIGFSQSAVATIVANQHALPILAETPYVFPISHGDYCYAIMASGTGNIYIKPMV